MAYDPNSLNLVIPRVGSGEGGANAGQSAALFIYRSDDARSAVIAADYLSDAQDRGMQVNDVVIVVDNTAAATIHLCTALSATGGATLSARPAIP